MKRDKIIVYVTMLSLISSSFPVHATTSETISSNNQKIESLRQEKEDLEDEKSNINAEVVELIKQMESKQEEIDAVQEKIDTLQNEINKLQESINKTTEEITITEKKIEETEELYQQKEKEQKYQEDVLSNRLKRNYMNNTYSELLGVILDSDSLSEILFKAKYIRDIVNNDKEIIANLKDSKIELAKVKYDLDSDKESLASHKASLEYQKESIKEKQEIVLNEKAILDDEMNDLNKLESEKQTKIQSIIKSQNYIQSQIEDLTVENKTLSSILQQTSSSASGAPNATNSFINPTTGTYTSKYGPRIHPITKKQSFHTGQDIAKSYGTKIVAADGGRVVRASYNGAYGNSIVIDHGNGYSTMYAHLQSFNVSAGDIVTQGQKIGEMGSTGWSTGPHLHYEVWYQGKHTDPMNYLH